MECRGTAGRGAGRRSAFLHELVGEPEIARVEDLHLRLHAIGLDERCLLAELGWRLHDDGLPSPKFSVPQSRVQISGRSSLTWTRRSSGPTQSVPGPKSSGFSPSPTTTSPPMPAVRLMMIGVLRPDAFHHLAVEVGVAGALAGFRIAHMAMDDRCASARRFEGGICDLFGRDRHFGALAHGVASTGNGACDDDFWLHVVPPTWQESNFGASQHLTNSAAECEITTWPCTMSPFCWYRNSR
jgi:hypothetical protein